MSTDNQDWSDAVSACEADGKMLAPISRDDERDAVLAAIVTSGYNEVWVNAYR